MNSIMALSTIFISMFLFSCSGTHSSKSKAFPELEKGKVITSVACLKNVSHTYALFLPANYSADKKYPLIICFDAHGSGYKPVELFREQAEKYGYIIAGSNVSKNGIPMQTTFDHYDIMLDDLLERLNVDKLRIYTCGFSGGSRVASSIAISKGGISGVIGCSAGFPQIKDGISHKFDYYGYTGNDDMNYIEMKALDRTLENNGFRHQLMVFNGTHDWPPKEYIAESILWIELNAMKDGKKMVDKDFVKKQLSVFVQQLTSLIKLKKPYEEYLLVKKIINYFDDLADIQKYQEQLTKLEKQTEVQQAIKQSQSNDAKEQMLQQQYVNKLSTENIGYWKAEINRMNHIISSTNEESEKHLMKRVMEYLSLALYSNCTSLYAQNRFTDAEHYIELYALIDPDNPEPEFMMAQIFAQKKDIEQSIAHLYECAELGFKEKSRLENDTIFIMLNNDKRFTDIIEKITQNQTKKP